MVESLSQKVMRNLSQRLHDDEFWSEAVVSWDVAEKVIVEKRLLSLKQLVECAYALCNAVIDDYKSLSHRVVRTIRSRTVSVDCVDGVVEERLDTAYGIELYLRRLYLTLKSQSFDIDNVQYVGSRQQCLYGCVCFVVMFFEAYDNFDAVGMKNVDWLMCIVLDRGCNDLNGGGKATIGKWEKMVLEGVGGGKKSICRCVFDLVNTKNPSGGMIGPGNCVWFHRLVLRVSGGVGGEWYEKLFKNHAAIHDAFSFLINQHDIGPGYMYGVYSDIKVESQHWWNRCCFMGQLSGLYMLGRLMTNKGKDIESFSSFDVHDKREKLGYDHLLPSDDDGRTRTPWHQDARRRGTHV